MESWKERAFRLYKEVSYAKDVSTRIVLITERTAKAEWALENAGWTYVEGAEAWKPPLGEEPPSLPNYSRPKFCDDVEYLRTRMSQTHSALQRMMRVTAQGQRISMSERASINAMLKAHGEGHTDWEEK